MDKAEINENISKIIEKLETLKTAKERYLEESLQYRWYRDDLHNSLWSKAVQPLVDEIENDLEELWDCILENTEWKKAGIKDTIRSRKHDDINRIDRLIHELRLIQKRLEIKSQRYQESAETKQDITHPKRRGAWTCIKKIPKWIYILVLFLAALLTIFYYLGWLEPIKKFIDEILSGK